MRSHCRIEPASRKIYRDVTILRQTGWRN
jgi:hypothetical protein